MSVAYHKRIMRRFYQEIWSAGRLSVLDELTEPDMVDHQRVQGWPIGREGLKELVIAWRMGFPDLREDVQDLIAEGDKVVARYALHGTHKGEFLGIRPTTHRVRVEGIDIARFHNGRIAEFWYSQDSYGLFRQLGVFPNDDQDIPGSS